MSIKFEKRPEVTVSTFRDELTGGLTIREFEKRLQGLDFSDKDAVTKEVKRCNDRCNGNTVDATLRVKHYNPNTGGTDENLLQLKFFMS